MNDVVIIGTGPAGLTAAIYAARAGLNPIVYAGMQNGGQLTTTTEIENFPGFAHGVMGPELMDQMSKQAERVGAKIIAKTIDRVDFSSKELKLWTYDEMITTKTVIIATGASANTLKLPDEAKLMGRGVSTCATCDGFFYKNRKVYIIGGGDTAMEEALYLAKLCESVTIIHRREDFKASKIMLERAKNHPKIKFLTPFTVVELKSDQTGLKQIVVENTSDNTQKTLDLDGLFYGIGHSPNSKIFEAYVDLDAHGYINVTNFTHTRTKGVFAAGDIADPHFKQAITAAGMGCQAAIAASKYIESEF